jgi:squalene-hopene/tetraprenyl-beta-curcumene cyclase
LPATCAAVTGLGACGQSSLGADRRAVEALLRHQRPEGGWGESVESVARGTYVDLGRCSPSQTAIVVKALLSVSTFAPAPAIERALDFLLWAQEPDGSWTDEDPTSASLTDVLYLRSPVEGIARPLLALDEYRKTRVASNRGS